MTLFSFVNDIVMTVTLLALLNETFKGCYAMIGFPGDQFLLISSLLDSDYHN